ncbi:hypothetical protein [Phenylobacterium immobile]|uniref:hypothetical protein n=1 Tax=Phenylobacterium immobile TaxID=21 RepID=UPI001C3FF947|nr:hypothetical protein [Phenylobacterium immobile]
MQDLASQIVELQAALDREIHARRKVLGWSLKNGLAEFEHGIALEHRRLRQSVPEYLSRASLATVLSAPVIYSLALPILLLDGWASLFQAICFRVYGVPQVPRAGYVLFDRRRLAYLNVIEALNCLYCAYANGVFAYVREIGSRTEQYWCPIKHALRVVDPHQRYNAFLDYGDAENYRARLARFRDALRKDASAAAETPPGA